MADGQIAGRLEIPVVADLSTFDERLAAAVEKAASRVEAKITAVLDAGDLREELQAKVEQAAQGIVATIRAVVDAGQLRQDLQARAAEASRGVEAKIAAVVDVDELRGELDAKAKAASEGVVVKIRAKVEDLAAEVTKAALAAQGAAEASTVAVAVQPDGRQFGTRLLALISKMQAEARAQPIEVPVKANTSAVGRLGQLLRPGLYIGLLALIQPLVALLGQAAAAAGSLVSAIAPAAGVLGALPALISTLVVAVGAGVVGFKGFTKAIQEYAGAQDKLKAAQESLAEKQGKVNKALAGLPAAQKAAVLGYGKLADKQAELNGKLAGLSPAEKAAARALERLQSNTARSARSQQRLNEQIAALSPAQQKAAREALKLQDQQRGLNAQLRGLSPAARQAVTDYKSLQKEQEAVAAAQKAVDEALGDLSPSAKVAALGIYSLRDAFKDAKKQVQESLFSQFAKDVEPAATKTLPLLRDGLKGVAGVLGGLVKDTLEWVQTPLFRAQFRVIVDNAKKSVDAYGKAGLSLGKAFANIAVAGGPLQARMDGLIVRFGAWAERVTTGEEAGARMRRFFDDAGDTAEQLGRILFDVGTGIFKTFSAGRGAGNTLLDGIERQAQRLADYVNSPEGFAAIKRYFDEAVPAARELAGLAGDIAKGLLILSRDANLAGIIRQIRDELGPAVLAVLENLGRSLGPEIISAVTGFVQALSSLSSATGPLVFIVRLFGDLASIINGVFEAVPGLANALGTLLGLVAVARVLKVLGVALVATKTALLGLRVALVRVAAVVAIPLGPLITGLTALGSAVVPTLTRAFVALGVAQGAAAATATALSSALLVIGTAAAAVELSQFSGDLKVADIDAKALADSVAQLGKNGELGQAGLDLMSTGMGPFRESAKSTADALDEFAISAYNALDEGWGARIRRAQDMGAAEAAFKDQVTQLDAAFAKAVRDGNIDEAAKAQERFKQAAIDNGVPVEKLVGLFPQYEAAVKGAATATQKQAAAARDAAERQATLGEQLKTSARGADTLKSSMDGLLGLFQTVPQAQATMADAIDNATAKLDAQGKKFLTQKGAIDLSTKSGRDFQAQLIDQISANAAVAEAIKRTGGSTEQANKAWNDGVAKIKRHLVQLGLAPREADKVARKYGAIKDAVKALPELQRTKVKVDGVEAAIRSLNVLRTTIRKVGNTTIKTETTKDGARFTTTTRNADGSTSSRFVEARARGGIFKGKGGPTDDANIVRISNGEFVVRAARTKRYRALLEALNSGSEQLIARAASGLAAGGQALASAATSTAAQVASLDVGPAGRPGIVLASTPELRPRRGDEGRPDRSGKTVIVDADGQLIGAMRTTNQRTHAQRKSADRLAAFGTWGVSPS